MERKRNNYKYKDTGLAKTLSHIVVEIIEYVPNSMVVKTIIKKNVTGEFAENKSHQFKWHFKSNDELILLPFEQLAQIKKDVNN